MVGEEGRPGAQGREPCCQPGGALLPGATFVRDGCTPASWKKGEFWGGTLG